VLRLWAQEEVCAAYTGDKTGTMCAEVSAKGSTVQVPSTPPPPCLPTLPIPWPPRI
jgi:hypothetical protein